MRMCEIMGDRGEEKGKRKKEPKKDAVTKKKLLQLVEQYNKIEKDIYAEIEELPRFGSSCKCDEPNKFRFIDLGEMGFEITEHCLNCGGYIEA